LGLLFVIGIGWDPREGAGAALGVVARSRESPPTNSLVVRLWPFDGVKGAVGSSSRSNVVVSSCSPDVLAALKLKLGNGMLDLTRRCSTVGDLKA